MAAGAYKGLTIKIGADTSKLSSALRGADSAIHKTQTQLNNLSKASKIDPGNNIVKGAQLGALASQATNAAREMELLKHGMKELSSIPVLNEKGMNSGKTVGELADKTQDVALAAQDATDAYARVNDRIAEASEKIKKLTGVDISKYTREGNFEAGVNAATEAAKKLGVSIGGEMQKVRALKADWVAARSALDNYANVAKLDQLNAKFAAQDANLKKVAADMREVQASFNLSSSSKLDQGLGEANSKLALLESASQTAMQRFQALDQAVKLDPTNIDLSAKRAEALAEATEVASKHAEMLRDKISHYESQGMTAEAKGVKDVALNLEEAKQKYAEAEARVAELVVEHAKLSEGAKVTADSMKEVGDSSEGLEKTARSAEDVAKELEEARQAASQAFTEMDTAKAIFEHQSLVDQLRQEDSTLVRLRSSFGNLRIQSNIAANFKDLNAQMKLVSTGADTAKNRFEQLKKASEIRPYSLSIAVEKVRALREATDAASQKAAILQQKLDAYKAAGVDKMSRQITDVAIAFEKANQRVKELQAEFNKVSREEGETSAKARELATQLANATQYAKTIGAVNEYRNLKAELRNVQTTSKEMSNAMKADLGDVGTAAFMAAQQLAQMAQQAWGKISESSNEVDAAYRNLRKTFNAEEGDYQKLYDAAMQYSQSHVTSADTMLNMEATAAQLGVGMKGGADAIQAFADAAANLDVATDIDADAIALQMGQIMAVMDDVKYTNIDKFGDALVRLGNNMPTQESNIMQITQRLSAVGNVAGFSTPQLLGWSAAVASTGQRSEAAATGLANLITNISVAVDDFDKGGDSLDKFAAVAGVSAEQFAKDWREGPSDALENLISKLGESETLFSDLSGMDVTGVRQTQTLAALSQTVGQLDDATRMASDAFNGLDDEFGAAGDAAREAEKKAEGFSGSFAKLQNSIQVLAASFGPAFVSILDMVADKIQWLTTVVSGWSDSFKQKVILAAGSFVAFNAISTFIGPLAKNLFSLGKGALGFVITKLAELKVALSLGKGGLMATDFGMKIGGISTKIAALGGASTIACGALAALAVVVAGYFAAKILKAKADADRFNKALEGISSSTSGMATELVIGSGKLSKYGQSWRDLKVDMEDYVSSLEEHNRKQAETRSEAGESITLLERYKSIIDKAAGAGKNYDGSLAQLKWAVDGLNEMLGTNYDYNEILKGSYNDAEGAAHSYRQEIENLIEVKKREIKTNALSDIYEEDLKAYEKAKRATQDEKDARDKFIAEESQKKRDNGTDVISIGPGKSRKMSDAELVADVTNDPRYKEFDDSIKALTEAEDELAEAVQESEHALNGQLNTMSYLTEQNFGVREGFMMNNDTIRESIASYMHFGDTIEEQQEGIKKLASGIQDMKVGTKEFADLIQNHPDLFTSMLADADGDMGKLIGLIDEWNRQELEEKFAGFTYDSTGYENAAGDRYDWNGGDWVFHQAGVEMDTTSVDEAEQKIENMQGDVETTFTANDEDVQQTAEQVNNMDGGEVETTFTANDEDVQQTVDQVNTLDGGEVVTTFTANTEGIDAAVNALNNLQGKDIVVNIVTGNTSGVDAVNGLLASVPTSVQTLITVTTNGVLNAIERIGALNTVAGKMQNVTRTYTANGNATGKTPSNNISSLNSAASNMSDHTASYTANGNAASGAAARNVWDLVNAVNHMQNKTVTLTTEHVTVNKTVQSGGGGAFATGTYINPNKIPRHAAGIFTQPTLTNIGWVGEDGAELYSGNSLVPLTNRKYSMPYIDDISSAVAKKLGTQSVGIDYELLGRSVATALAGMSVTIDGQALVGEIATQVERTSRFYAG